MNDKSALLPLLAVLTALGAPACMKQDAKMPLVTPALVVPAPPARTILPSTIQPEEPVPPPTAPANAPPTPPKPETPPPATRTAPPPTAPPPTPPSTTNTETARPVEKAAASAQMKEIENRVNAMLKDADDLLKKLKDVPLSREAAEQYTTALSHSRTAKDALKDNNFPYALELAQKALTIAKQLIK